MCLAKITQKTTGTSKTDNKWGFKNNSHTHTQVLCMIL